MNRAQHEQPVRIDRHSSRLNHTCSESQFRAHVFAGRTRAVDLTMIIGFAGGVAVLCGFAGSATGRLSTQGAVYHALNLAGGLALVTAGLPSGAWPSVLVNGTWALISAYGITRTRSQLPQNHIPPTG